MTEYKISTCPHIQDPSEIGDGGMIITDTYGAMYICGECVDEIIGRRAYSIVEDILHKREQEKKQNEFNR